MPGIYFDILRLHQALSVWGETAFTLQLSQEMLNRYKLTGDSKIPRKRKEEILKFQERFQERLLKANEEEYDPTFMFETDMGSGDFPFSLFSCMLYSWTRNSRVVYHVPDDLRVLLQATSFQSSKWHEIPWPFDSFIVTLDKPVVSASGVPIDTIIFTRAKDGDEDLLFFMFLPATMEKYEPLTQQQKERLFLLLQRGNTRKVLDQLPRIAKRKLKLASFYYIMASPAKMIDIRLQDTALADPVPPNDGNEEEAPLDSETLAICRELALMTAALALYISTIPPGQATPKPRSSLIPPAIKKQDPRLISSPSRVCHLTNTFKLSSEEIEEFEEAMRKERTGMVVPHHRRGYFRRPNGLGHEPSAPRTIWVRPAFVNRRHLPEDTLPGGALVRVEPPK